MIAGWWRRVPVHFELHRRDSDSEAGLRRCQLPRGLFLDTLRIADHSSGTTASDWPRWTEETWDCHISLALVVMR